jgi:hypothetical protein
VKILKCVQAPKDEGSAAYRFLSMQILKLADSEANKY